MQPVPYRGLERVAFNQPENNLNSTLKHLFFGDVSGTLSIFYLPWNSRRNATEISPVISPL